MITEGFRLKEGRKDNTMPNFPDYIVISLRGNALSLGSWYHNNVFESEKEDQEANAR